MIYESGALAHLGERFLCKEEVNGSSPLGSTIFVKSVDGVISL